MVNSVYVKPGRVRQWLDKFAKDYKTLRYKRIDYTAWNYLYKCDSKLLVQDYNNKTRFVDISRAGNGISFDYFDNSFGEFLHTECKDFQTLFNSNALEENTTLYTKEQMNLASTAVDGISSKASAIANKITTIDTDWLSTDSTNKIDSDWVNVAASNWESNKAQVNVNGTFDGNSLKIGGKPIIINDNGVLEVKKEKKEMKGFNFDFGPCTGDNVRMSMYGLAIKNTAGVWVSYNKGAIIDVDCFNFDGGKYMYKMPVPVNQVKVGDVVIHNKVPMFVTDIKGNDISVIDIREGEKKSIIPTTNMFNFNFVTKVVSLFNMFGDAPSPEQPFGNFLPLMMMGEDNSDIDPMVMFLMMQSGGNFTANPMLMYMMMSKDKSIDPMLLLLMSQNGTFNAASPKN